jgi:phenylalanyl-tRNA synthetase beta chain
VRVSERWLRAWCDPPLARAQLAETFTLAGLEVERVEPLPSLDAGIVLGHVLDVQPHPNAERLRVCQVAAGTGEPAQVVCGAPNVRAGMHAPLATIGATLPGGVRIKAARLRGQNSAGMLCSAAELGLGSDADGLLELPSGAPGTPIAQILELDDAVFHFGLTPNRGDCLSVRGLARELAALTGALLRTPAQAGVPPANDETVPVRIEAPADCPRYVCRVVRDLDSAAATPAWMRERLRRAGLRSLGPVVDVTNYVLLEHGQPLHAFDLQRFGDPGIVVRRARAQERLTLLGGQEIGLDENALVIANAQRPLALAGVIGGAGSAVGPDTRHVLLESAWFAPATVARTARRHGLITDAALRFERGADPAAQAQAIEWATQLLVEICGGRPGPVVDRQEPAHLPAPARIRLRPARAQRVLGTSLATPWCTAALERLGAAVTPFGDALEVVAPSWRSDWRIEEDLIEELARLHGYAALPAAPARIVADMPRLDPRRAPAREVAAALCARGYQEAMTYAFLDAAWQGRCDPAARPVALGNPLSAELAVLRTQVWPGLVRAAAYNANRQTDRVRLFEIGRRFRPDAGGRPAEEAVLAGVALGAALPEQWGATARPLDLFDLKGDLALLPGAGGDGWTYEALEHAALHPGQSARILGADGVIGFVGRLHPQLERELDLPPTWVFEIALEAACQRAVARHAGVDRFPSVRRDLALVVPEQVPAQRVEETLREIAGAALRECVLFDVYRGPGIPTGMRSLAFGLRLAHTERTLTDDEVDAVVARAVAVLAARHGARLRE